jgi:NAD(P)-dependent dehydrogenase (short-subunit alcohol dehydrogenase family)
MGNNVFDLSGKVAIVTGASRGLGQYLGRALAHAGADLVITARKLESLDPFRREIESLGRRAVPLELDVRNYESIQRMVEAAEVAYGKIDILVNNAGCNVRKPALEVAWDDWNLVIDTNLRGTFFVAQAVAKRMIPRRYGHLRFWLRGTRTVLRQPGRRQAAHHESCRRLGAVRDQRKLPGARMVQDEAD